LRLNHIESGTGPPVVLLHGLFGAARNFGMVQRALAQLFRVIAMDARNHGASPHAAGMRYAMLAADVLETAITTSWDEVARLGAIAAIRTFLNYFLERDLGEIRQRQSPPGAGP